MKARECVEGSIEHCEWSRLVGDGQCSGRILGRPCARVQTVSVQTERLDARMLPGGIATHPLGLILYTITAGGFFYRKLAIVPYFCGQARGSGSRRLDRHPHSQKIEDGDGCREVSERKKSLKRSSIDYRRGLSALGAAGC